MAAPKRETESQTETRRARQAELALEYRRSGSQAAFVELLASVGGLIRNEVRAAAWSQIPEEDLRSEAVVGVLHAIEKFEPERGPFSMAASWYIRGAVVKFAHKQSKSVTVPSDSKEKKAQTHGPRFYARCTDAGMAHSDAVKAVAAALGLAPDRIECVLRLAQGAASLDAIAELADGATATLEALADDDTKRVLASVLDMLTARERVIIRRRFLNGEECEALPAIGADFGVSGERIRQIERVALEKLRREFRRRGLEFDDLMT